MAKLAVGSGIKLSMLWRQADVLSQMVKLSGTIVFKYSIHIGSWLGVLRRDERREKPPPSLGTLALGAKHASPI